MVPGGIGAKTQTFQQSYLDLTKVIKNKVKNYSIVVETGEIPSGERKRVELNGQPITIFNIKNTYYAINDTCPYKKTAHW